MEGAKAIFSFTLILAGFDDITPEIEEALHTAGCTDGLLGIRCGTPYLFFDREGSNLEETIRSAIQAVETCGQGIEVVRVLPPEADTIEMINAFLRLKRQILAQLPRDLPREQVSRALSRLIEHDPEALRRLLNLNPA